MTPDANYADGSPSPEPSGDHIPADTTIEMSEVKSPRDDSEDKSPVKSQDDNETRAKKNAKDPSRPRRKKARRACFACQRAHLTCGDERPCLRCIKRGLAEHCHDGVRKKAKYLHDAPNESLVPGLGGSYQPTTSPVGGSSLDVSNNQIAQPGGFFANQLSPAELSDFNQGVLHGHTQSPSTNSPMIDPFSNNQSSLPQANFSHGSQSVNQMPPPVAPAEQHNTPHGRQQTPQYNTPFIDPADPSFFNFDISGLNFGNQYGALEFGMLGHMASGAGDTPDDSSLMSSLNQGGAIPFDSSTSPNAYSTAGANYSYGYPYPNSVNQHQRKDNNGQVFGIAMGNNDANGNLPGAFAIGEGNGSVSSTSPGNTGMDFNAYGSSPVANGNLFNPRASHHDFPRQTHQQRAPFPTTTGQTQDLPRKRKRDPSHIYSSVQAPYSYTTGFHSLTAFIQSRFSPQKTLRIAKALASIRPSFIACTKELNRDDLIFMEKCFQRTLLQYEDFISAYGCPTLICRRTGEVAAVSKEFSLLTGWRRDVLLGKEPNLNINTGGTSGVGTGTSSRGAATPNKPNAEAVQGRPQPVFLAELLDDDSVISFYEDFAKLAFGDSRGYVVKPCKLLKYKTKDDALFNSDNNGSFDRHDGAGNANGQSGQEAQKGDANAQLFSGEAGVNALGDKDGKVDCMFCWAVKRDVFDIPMSITLNFLPII